jgi:hypothetical protein
MTREERLALHLDRKEFRQEGPPPKVKPTRCVYVSLKSGKAHVCGEDGYPYCANHRMKTAPIGGSRYTNKDFI